MIGNTLVGWGRLLGLGKKRSTVEEERRIWGRLRCDFRTTCKPTRDREADAVPTRVKNVSMGGTCLHLPVEFPPGELLSLHLPSAEGEVSDILACVVRCIPLDETTWVVGCVFASALNSQDLRRFDPAIGEQSPSDRRGWERFPCQARAVYQLLRGPESDETHAATIVNISGSGLALEAEHGLEIGDLVSVDLYHGEEHVVTALASVVRTYRDERRRVAGCNFIQELGEETLTRLLG